MSEQFWITTVIIAFLGGMLPGMAMAWWLADHRYMKKTKECETCHGEGRLPLEQGR